MTQTLHATGDEQEIENPQVPGGFHVMTKPIGPICNLDCTYCYYLEKEHLYPDAKQWRMTDEVLENYVRQYIAAQPPEAPEISFAWQGGEPTLLGVRYFQKVVAYQKKYANGRIVTNALQTNGTLLDDAWCEFLAEHHFLIGLSVDGPRELHDHYRVDKKQQATFDEVMRGLKYLQKHKVEFNTLTVVNDANVKRPLEVYNFLKEIGSQFIQFIPIVERQVEAIPLTVEGSEHFLAGPLEQGQTKRTPVTPWSVEPKAYGEFLAMIFDQWVRKDVGQVYVQLFDVALGNWAGAGSSLCLFMENCGRALVMEHNGDVYSCDHYVYPKYRLGNIAEQSLGEMVLSSDQKKFGQDKSSTLPEYCKRCEVRFACHGECPKHRFTYTPDGEPGLNYLCPAYKHFFNHIDPYMKTMTQLLREGQPPARIMSMLAAPQPGPSRVGRNSACPCGSGKKYKKCCGG